MPGDVPNHGESSIQPDRGKLFGLDPGFPLELFRKRHKDKNDDNNSNA
jgi:hypothetical protein